MFNGTLVSHMMLSHNGTGSTESLTKAFKLLT